MAKFNMFVAGVKSGVVGKSVKASDVVATPFTLPEVLIYDAIHEHLTEAAMDLVYEVIETGKTVFITDRSTKVKEDVAKVLNYAIVDEATSLVETMVKAGNLDKLEKMTLCQAVSDYVIDEFYKTKEKNDMKKEAKKTVAVAVGKTAVSTTQTKEMVTVKNETKLVKKFESFKAGQVVHSKAGSGKLLGFEEDAFLGMLAHIQVGEGEEGVAKVMVEKISKKAIEEDTPPWVEDASANNGFSLADLNQAVNELADLEKQAEEAEGEEKGALEMAAKNAEKVVANAMKEAKDKPQVKVNAAAKSKAAQNILAKAGVAVQAGKKPAATGGRQTVGNKPATQGARNAAQTPNTKKEGTTVKTENNARGGRQSAGTAVAPRPERQATSRINFDKVEGKGKMFVGNSTPWYLRAENFQDVIYGEDFAATRVNEALGIKNMLILDPADQMQNPGSTIAIVEVDFGGIRVPFRIGESTKADAREPLYSSNMGLKKSDGGNWFRFYKTSKKVEEKYEDVLLPYGFRIEQGLFAQVMAFAHYALGFDMPEVVEAPAAE